MTIKEELPPGAVPPEEVPEANAHYLHSFPLLSNVTIVQELKSYL
jgi:hypothetical protein